MATRSSRARFALVAAAVLALSLAGPVSAATSATISEGVTVNETLTLTLEYTAFSYNGHGGVGLEPGATSTEQGVWMNAGANRPWHVTVTGGDFWSGGNMMPGTIRTWRVGDDSTVYPFATGGTVVASAASGITDTHLWWKITVPGDAPGGDYTSSMVFVVTAP